MLRAKILYFAISASALTTACSGGGGGGHSGHGGGGGNSAVRAQNLPGQANPNVPAPQYNPNMKDISNQTTTTVGNPSINTPISSEQTLNANNTFFGAGNGAVPITADTVANTNGALTPEHVSNPVEPGSAEGSGATDLRVMVRPQIQNPMQVSATATVDANQNQYAAPTEGPVVTSAAAASIDPNSQQAPSAVNTPPAPPVAPFIVYDAQVEPWIPGLYREPVTNPSIQDGELTKTERSPGVPYTDAKQDSLIGFYVGKLDSETKLKDANEAFARQIEDASFTNDRNFVTAQIAVDEDSTRGATPTMIQLAGLVKGRTALLTSKGGDTKFYHYKAYFTCWDVAENSCQSSVVELIRYAKPQASTAQNKKALLPLARSFIIHRIGDAFIVPSDDTGIYNSAHKAFNTYTKDSVRNACLRQKAVETKPDLKAAYERWCPGEKYSARGAQRILLSSWAAARGRAQFFVVFQNDNDQTWAEPDAVVIGGDAVISQQPSPLQGYEKTPANARIHGVLALDKNDGAELMADDAAGAFNIRLKFAGNPAEETRFSIVSNFPETKIPSDDKKPAAVAQAAPPAAQPAQPTATSKTDAKPPTFDPTH